MNIRKRLYYLLVLIFLVIMAGSTGYYIIFNGEPKFLDCLYMTVVSLTTVGYGEIIEITGNPTAQIFTMVLITFGMGVILYGISSLTALFLEGELSGILRKKRMAKHIDKINDHYIVCGGGETGSGVIVQCGHERFVVARVDAVILGQNRKQSCGVGGDELVDVLTPARLAPTFDEADPAVASMTRSQYR